MSVKNVKAFYGKVEEDKALQAKLKALDKKAKEAQDAVIGELVGIAKTEGFVFTPKDLFKVRSEQPKTKLQAEQVNRDAICTIEWPSCIEANASCYIATPPGGGGCRPGSISDVCGRPPDPS